MRPLRPRKKRKASTNYGINQLFKGLAALSTDENDKLGGTMKLLYKYAIQDKPMVKRHAG